MALLKLCMNFTSKAILQFLINNSGSDYNFYSAKNSAHSPSFGNSAYEHVTLRLRSVQVLM